MRIDEVVKPTNLTAKHYRNILTILKQRSTNNGKATKIKNTVVSSWKDGIKSAAYYRKLLNKLEISIHDVID